MSEAPLVCVVDDDEFVRESLLGLLRTEGFRVEEYPSAQEFLASPSLAGTACLILDIRLPGMTGPELQQELLTRRQRVPIVFMTAHGDEEIGPRLVALGATDYLLKPFGDDALLDAVRKALKAN